MPKPNGKAVWAKRTYVEAVATAKDIMRGVSLDVHALTFDTGYVNVNGAQWDNYYEAARDAVAVIMGAVVLVEHMERGAT
jgi:hypothetical protein